MRANKQMEKQASRIAGAIVDLVERTDGPVTLEQIEREVEGFVTSGPPSWSYALGERPEQPAVVVWGGGGRTIQPWGHF